jgi:hypothetical protein
MNQYVELYRLKPICGAQAGGKMQVIVAHFAFVQEHCQRFIGS